MRRISQAATPALAALTALMAVMTVSPPAYAAPGDLDTTFSGDGRVITSVDGSSLGYDVAIQSDGKIVVVGNESFALARYRTNGSLDPAFGTGGTEKIVVGQACNGTALAIQSDGKIVVVGDATTNGGKTGFGVIRLRTDGSLDTTFGGGDGKILTTLLNDAGATAVAIQDDGAIVVVGRATGTHHTYFATVRYTPQGVRDTTFGGGDGIVLSKFTDTSDASATGVAIQSDGKIVVAGTQSTPSVERFGLIRYGPLGNRDGSFGTGGRVTTAFAQATHSEANAVQIRSSGKIVVAGQADPQGNLSWATAQYLKDGTLDTSFDGDGEATTPGPGARDVARQANGMLVEVGASNGNFVLIRYTAVGGVDTSFGNGGTVVTSFGAGEDAFSFAVAIQSNGRIVAAGGAVDDEGGHAFAAARYLAS
jgi:uncharacterized delta-60 repeat protein